MTLQQGEVVLGRLAFHQGPGVKFRPAVVLLDLGDDDVVVAIVTTKDKQSAFDMPGRDWLAAGLTAPSFLRLHKMNVVPKGDVVKRLGRLSSDDFAEMRTLLGKAFGP